MSFCRWPVFFGMKPRNVNARVGSPDATSAAMAAFAPGIGVIVWPAAIAATTSASPGSESAGVPASDTSATSHPRSSWPTRTATCRLWLNSLYAVRCLARIS